MTRKTWAFEDFTEGNVIDLGGRDVTAQEVIEFASEFDPQPMHLDEASGRASILGGLSASGWHTCSMFMRLFCDSLLLHSTSQGSPGVDQIKWKKPVLAGDRLTGRSTVVSARPSKSRPSLGLVALRSELSNQRGEVVLELESTVMFLKREAT
jgi:acyl dehydratase